MAENNNNENLNEVERPTIAELKDRATGIKVETDAGANTAERVGGLMYDMIDVLDAEIEQHGGTTLNAPLSAINAAGLGTPSNNKFLAYKNNVWTYVDLSTIVSSVDWSNVANKPDLTNLPYLADSTPYGAGLSYSDGAIYLKDQYDNVLAYADISSGGGGGGSDAYAVRYIPSGQNAGNVKLPVDSPGDYKKGDLWANSIIIGNADTIYGSIAKSAGTNDIIFDNNLNGGIFEFDKSIATTSSKIILGNRMSKKVEISIPSGSGITDKLDINTFTYVTDTGYTQDTGGSIYLNGVAIGSGGGGGGGLTTGSWAAFFDLNTKGSGDTTGYLYLNNDGVGLKNETYGDNLYLNGNVLYLRKGTTNLNNVQLSSYGTSLSLAGNSLSLMNGETTLNTVTIPSSGGSGVAAISVGGTQVSGSGDTFSMTGSGGTKLTAITSGTGGVLIDSWKPSGGTDQQPKVSTDDIVNNAVTANKLNNDVGTKCLNADGITSLVSLLNRVAPNMEITAASNGVNKYVFFGVETLANGSTLVNNSFFYYDTTSGDVSKPIIYVSSNEIKICLQSDDSTNFKYYIWNGNNPTGGSSVSPTTQSGDIDSILGRVVNDLSLLNITVTVASPNYMTRTESNMPNVRAKLVPGI